MPPTTARRWRQAYWCQWTSASLAFLINLIS